MNAADVAVKQQPDDVTVVPRRRLARWLSRRPTVLTERGVERMYEAARRSMTWR